MSSNGDKDPAAKEARMVMYLGDKEMSDVVLQVENMDLHVHKTVLAAKSPYFKRMFFSEGSDMTKNTFIVEEKWCHFCLILTVFYSHRETGAYLKYACCAVLSSILRGTRPKIVVSSAMAKSDTAPVHHYLGDKELSDVVLVVQGKEYHAHKMLLAARSPYFKRLFFSDGADKSIQKLQINVIDSHIRFILCALYSPREVGMVTPPICSGFPIGSYGDANKTPQLSEIWDKYSSIMKLAEKYEVAADVRNIIEQRIILIFCGDTTCLRCTMRLLVALHHKFHQVFPRFKMTAQCISFCLRKLDPSSVFPISPQCLSALLERISGRERYFRVTNAIKEPKAVVKESDPKFFHYGDIQLSDVTLVVGNSKFQVHKMFLAARSSYFRAIFFTPFGEQDINKIHIDADVESFKHMMDLLYNSSLSDSSYLKCGSNSTLRDAFSRVKRFWEILTGLLKLMKQFDISTDSLQLLIRAHFCGKESCVECANKGFLALHFNLSAERVKSSQQSIAICLKNFPECLPEQLNFAPNDLAGLVEFFSRQPPKPLMSVNC